MVMTSGRAIWDQPTYIFSTEQRACGGVGFATALALTYRSAVFIVAALNPGELLRGTGGGYWVAIGKIGMCQPYICKRENLCIHSADMLLLTHSSAEYGCKQQNC